MMHTVIDHLVVGAASLADGERLALRLGVELRPGGRHPQMGTHNHLLRLGKRQYLEVIAIDPDAPPPVRPRWFGLDDPTVQGKLAERPRLLGWVARTDSIEEARGAAPDLFGPVEAMRRGELAWRITIRPDGTMPEGGVLPALIQWPEDVHPADAMGDTGCRLESLTLRHPRPEVIRSRLSEVLFVAGATAVTVTPTEGAPGLVATLRGRRGLVTLD